MRHFNFLSAARSLCAGLCLALLLPTAARAEPHPWERRLPFEQATIHYTISGTEKGSQTLYIKERGRYTSLHKKSATRLLGMRQPEQETLEIKTPDWVYSVDMTARTATQSVSPEKIMIEEFRRLSPADRKKALLNAEKFGLGTLNSMGGELQRKSATLLGHTCDVVRVMGSENYNIADTDVALKTTVKLMGMSSTIEASRIDTGSVPADVFSVPAGIPVTRTPNDEEMVREHARAVVQMLVSGEGPTVQASPPKAGAKPAPDSEPDAGAGKTGIKDLSKLLKQLGKSQQ